MKRKMIPSDVFAVRLRQARLASGMTQAAVTRHIRVDRSTYTKYETGRAEPSLQTAYDLATLFHVTLDEMLKED